MDRDDSSLQRRSISAFRVYSIERVLQIRWRLGRHLRFFEAHVALSPNAHANKVPGLFYMLGLGVLPCIHILEK
jgi:hypothetical protein